MLERLRKQWQLSPWICLPKQPQSPIKGLECGWRVIGLQSSWSPKNLGSVISEGTIGLHCKCSVDGLARKSKGKKAWSSFCLGFHWKVVLTLRVGLPTSNNMIKKISNTLCPSACLLIYYRTSQVDNQDEQFYHKYKRKCNVCLSRAGLLFNMMISSSVHFSIKMI